MSDQQLPAPPPLPRSSLDSIDLELEGPEIVDETARAHISRLSNDVRKMRRDARAEITALRQESASLRQEIRQFMALPAAMLANTVTAGAEHGGSTGPAALSITSIVLLAGFVLPRWFSRGSGMAGTPPVATPAPPPPPLADDSDVLPSDAPSLPPLERPRRQPKAPR